MDKLRGVHLWRGLAIHDDQVRLPRLAGSVRRLGRARTGGRATVARLAKTPQPHVVDVVAGPDHLLDRRPDRVAVRLVVAEQDRVDPPGPQFRAHRLQPGRIRGYRM